MTLVPDGVTSKLKDILHKGLTRSASKKICGCDRDFFGVDNREQGATAIATMVIVNKLLCNR